MVSLADLMDSSGDLRRLELKGCLARAARLALQDNEQADTVEFSVTAGPEGLTVDCSLWCGDQQLAGWGE